MRVINPANPVDQMRLHTGDYMEDLQYLPDSVYMHFYTQTGNSIIEGSILALESIINNVALSPESWKVGDVSESRPLVSVLNDRLNALRTKTVGGKQVPVILKSDRKGWCDFDKAFK